MSAILTAVAAMLAKEAKKMAVRYANGNQPAVATFAGKWTLAQTERTGIWTARIDAADPLRLVHRDGIEFTPVRRVFATDFGSIPGWAQGIEPLRLKPDVFRKSYAFHDAAYQEGKLLARRPETGWALVELTRTEADILLFWGLSGEVPEDAREATRAECQAIYRAVRIGAGMAWNGYRTQKV